MILQVCVRRRRYAKADTPGHGFASKKCFELAAKEMRREAKIARVFVEHGDQIVWHDVFVCV